MDEQKILVIMKGTEATAITECRHRGITILDMTDLGRETRFYVPITDKLKVVLWYNEFDATKSAAQPGDLLWYRP